MNVHALTSRAAALCADVGVECRYEYDRDRWRWNFYRGRARLHSLLDPDAVLPYCDKLLDLDSKHGYS